MRRPTAFESLDMCQGLPDSADCRTTLPTAMAGGKGLQKSVHCSQPGEHDSLLFSQKLWKAVGLEKRLLSCRWSLYHPEFPYDESEHNDGLLASYSKENAKTHRSCRARPSRTRLLRSAQEQPLCPQDEADHKPSTSGQQRSPPDLGDCGICSTPVEETVLHMRPALECHKCQRSVHFDCYSQLKDCVPIPNQAVFCPEHDPVATTSKRKAPLTNTRRVRSRITDDSDSVSEVDEAERFELCLSAVPKQLRSALRSSATPCARRKPRNFQKIQPELKLSTRWPSLIDSDQELTWGISKHTCDQVYAAAQETGSNQSSPTHADCSLAAAHLGAVAVQADSGTDVHTSPPETDDTSPDSDLSDGENVRAALERASARRLRLHSGNLTRACSTLVPARGGLVTSA